jgi:hypothetical protein
MPSSGELASFYAARNQYGESNLQFNPLFRYVDGRDGLSNPSTDDLIQWVAHKWGIPEDWIRAQIVVESYWRMSTVGDRASVPSAWYNLYPPAARIAGTGEVYESMGIAQVKWEPDGSVGAGTEPLRWESTAFNLDYYAATVRYYFDGDCGWCGSGYGPGQRWNSIGAWFNPYPWGNGGQTSYVGEVQAELNRRTWEQSGF